MRVAIGLVLAEFPFATAAGYWRWVDLCEAGSVDSLWQTDRLLGRAPILECLTAAAALAGRTRRLKFGMNVLSLAFRDPVLVAKQCATIDVLSEGRLLPAFGIGSPLHAYRTPNAGDTSSGFLMSENRTERAIGQKRRSSRMPISTKTIVRPNSRQTVMIAEMVTSG